MPEGHAERLLEADRRREGKRAPAGERLLESRQADPGVVGETLTRDPAPGELLPDDAGHRAALLRRKLGVG
jgi:hypothetical protein